MGRQPNFGTPIAFGLILAALVIGYFDYSSNTGRTASQRKVLLKGSASRAIKADRAVWTGRTVNESSSLSRVRDMVQKDRELLQGFVKERGFDSTRIEFPPVQLQRDPSGPGTRYTLVQDFRLTGNELARVRACAKEASDLMGRGISIESDHPLYYYSELERLREELLQEAFADAKAKANAVADTSSVSISGLHSLEEGVLTVRGKDLGQGLGPDNQKMSSPEGTVELQVEASYRFE